MRTLYFFPKSDVFEIAARSSVVVACVLHVLDEIVGLDSLVTRLYFYKLFFGHEEIVHSMNFAWPWLPGSVRDRKFEGIWIFSPHSFVEGSLMTAKLPFRSQKDPRLKEAGSL